MTSYALDETGALQANAISGEVIDLVQARLSAYGYVVPSATLFYSTGLVVRYTGPAAQPRTMVAGVDYAPIFRLVAASETAGNYVYGGIALFDLTLKGTLSLDYHALGGAWSLDQAVIAVYAERNTYNPNIAFLEVVPRDTVYLPGQTTAVQFTDFASIAQATAAANLIFLSVAIRASTEAAPSTSGSLSVAATGTSLTLTDSTGASVALPLATTTLAGVLSASDKSKLDNFAGTQSLQSLGGYPASNPSNFITAAQAPVQTVAGRAGSVTLTKADVGLGSVDNVADADKPVSTAQTSAISSASATANTYTDTGIAAEATLRLAADAALGVRIDNVLSNTDAVALNSLSELVTAFQAADSSLIASISALTTNAGTALSAEVSRATAAESLLVPKTTTVNGYALTGNVTVSATDVGLGNVNNTADSVKPVSAAQTTAIANAVAAEATARDTAIATATTSLKGTATSAADTLGKLQGLITGTNSGVNTGDQTTITGNAGSATVLQTARNINGVSFNGSADITVNAVDATARVASSLLGANNGVATLGAGGVVPAAQSLVQSVAGKTGVVALVKVDVGLGSVDNVADASKPVSTAQAAANAAVLTAATTYTDTETTRATGAEATLSTAVTAAINASAPIAHVGSGGAAHALVVNAGAAGFMSGADKAKLDTLNAGVPAGGTSGQTLVKNSSTDYDVSWQALPAIINQLSAYQYGGL